ncbi:hypothetical protein IWQ55_003344 [Labrenzia sp. EL_208]|nr:hypothetical protein [Labrenzia sp. EL_132]MBG6230128.1 hypothetical protein [Labrenzia sp. EL_208]
MDRGYFWLFNLACTFVTVFNIQRNPGMAHVSIF